MYGCTSWQCTFCAKIFLSHDQLKSHVINAHGRKSAEDMFDLKPAPGAQNVQDSSEVMECNTVESHRLQDSSEVTECNTVESHSLSDHNTTTTGVRRAKPMPLYKYNTKYRCEYCDKIFSNPKQLRSHVICEHEPRKSSASNASASKTVLKVRNVQELQ